MKIFRSLAFLHRRFFNTMTRDRYIWIDLEMTGLNPEVDKILEISCIITTPSLIKVGNEINVVIHQSNEILNSMNDWCMKHHNESGLVQECIASTINLADAEQQVIRHIKSNTEENGTNYLAGNSIYMDLSFLKKYMPSLSSLFHYRLLDVSTIKVLVGHWFKEFEFEKQKIKSHRSLSDINESILELKHYRDTVFKK